MSMSPRVSILIPTYNRAHYLPQTIASALAQAYRDLELIVVDDGSTDDTPAVVAAENDPRVRLIRQENRGVGAALDTGWQAAHGEFVSLLGSDDLMLPALVETLLPIVERDPAVSLVYGRAAAIDAHGNPLPQRYGASPKFPGQWLKSILYANCVCPTACLIRRSRIAEVGGFDSSLASNEDWDLWIRMAERAPFAFCDQVLGLYRLHAQSLTGRGSAQYERTIQSRIQLVTKFYARETIPPEAREVRELAFRNVYMDAMIRYLTIGDRRSAVTYLQRAARATSHPWSNTLRAVAVAIFDLYLSKTRWGVWLADSLVALRHTG